MTFQIIAEANDGGGDYTVSIAISHNLCDSFHTVSGKLLYPKARDRTEEMFIYLTVG